MVRCDNALPGIAYPGCVIYSSTPSIVYHSSGLFPELARHIAEAQASGVPGARGSGTLALACPDAVVLWAGIHTGVVGLAVEIAGQAPALDVAPRDDVVEVSFTAPTGRLRPAALMAEIEPPFPALPTLAGELRARVHARGRDTDIDGTPAEPVEQYLIQVWPADPSPEQVHTATDRYGQLLRESARDAVPWEPSPKEAAAAAHQAEIDEFLICKHAEAIYLFYDDTHEPVLSDPIAEPASCIRG